MSELLQLARAQVQTWITEARHPILYICLGGRNRVNANLCKLLARIQILGAQIHCLMLNFPVSNVYFHACIEKSHSLSTCLDLLRSLIMDCRVKAKSFLQIWTHGGLTSRAWHHASATVSSASRRAARLAARTVSTKHSSAQLPSFSSRSQRWCCVCGWLHCRAARQCV